MAANNDNLNLDEISRELSDIAAALDGIADYYASNSGTGSGGNGSGGKANDTTGQKGFKRFNKALGSIGKSFNGSGLSISKVIGEVGKLNIALGITATAIVKVTSATAKYNNALSDAMSRLGGASTDASGLSKGLRNVSSGFSEFMQTIGNSFLGKFIGGFTDLMGEGLRGLSSFIETGNPANDTRPGASNTENYLRGFAGSSKRDLDELTGGYDALYYAIAGGGYASARTEEGAKALFERILQYGEEHTGIDVSNMMAEYASMISGTSGTSKYSGASLDSNIMAYLAMEKYGVLPEMLGEEPLTELAVSSLLEQTNTALSDQYETLVTNQRAWRKYGEAIKESKQELFSFDKVITVNAKIRDSEGDNWRGGFTPGKKEDTASGLPVIAGGTGTGGGSGLAEKTQEVMDEAFEAAKETITNSIKATDVETQPAMEEIWETVKTMISASVLSGAVATTSGVKTIWTAIKGVIKTAIGAVALPVTAGIKGIWTAIKAVVKTAINGVVLPVKTGLKTIWSAIKTSVTTAIAAVALPVSSGLKTVWKAITNKIKNSVSESTVSTNSAVTSLVSEATDKITESAGKAKLDLSTDVNNIWKSIYDTILGKIKNTSVSVSTGLSNVWSSITSKIIEAISGVVVGHVEGKQVPGHGTVGTEEDTQGEKGVYRGNIKDGVVNLTPQGVKSQVNGGAAISMPVSGDMSASNLESALELIAIIGLAAGGLAAAIGTPELVAALGGTLGGLGLENIAFIGARASGGVITGPAYGLVGEAGKEAIIPLENDIGIKYLANAMNEAGGGSKTTVNVNLSGTILEMNDYNVRKLAEKLNAAMENEKNRRGGINYD